MQISAPSKRGIMSVNGHLLQAFLFGVCAWWVWPTSPEWWGFGVLSIALGAGTLNKLFAAISAMVKLYEREKELAHFASTSRAPTPSDLADHDALKNAGMIDE